MDISLVNMAASALIELPLRFVAKGVLTVGIYVAGFNVPESVGFRTPVVIQSTSAGTSATPPLDDADMLSSDLTDHLTKVRCINAKSVELTFADGAVKRVTISKLGLPPGEVDLRTAKATPTGLSVKPTKGRRFVIDSATLRYIADPAYAALLDNAVSELMIPSEQLERIAARNQPPQEWYESTEE